MLTMDVAPPVRIASATRKVSAPRPTATRTILAILEADLAADGLGRIVFLSGNLGSCSPSWIV